MSETFTPIETQEDFDAAIKSRLERERNTVREEFKGYLSPEDVQKQYDGYLSPEEVQKKYEGYLAPEEAAKKDDVIKKYELKSKRVEIALEQGIPYELAGKISGDTEEEMKKDAESFAGFLKKSNPYPEYNPEPRGTEESKNAAMKRMLDSLSK